MVVAAAIIVPLSVQQSPLWLIDLYGETLSSYAYATLNLSLIHI